MKEYSKIPTGKVQRATKMFRTGVKVGGNYLKHYGKKAFSSEGTREELDKKNAEEIFQTLGEMKGTVMKAAQMLSMDRTVLPLPYIEKFSEAQHKAPPLSYPLIVKRFKKEFGKAPSELFDTFTRNAVNAASIGQVHLGVIDDQKYAVKVQYPGVANSVTSDLNLLRPIATRILGMDSDEVNYFLSEIEETLIEETDYRLEFERGTFLPKACGQLEGIVFPSYIDALSGKNILTMTWIEGQHLDDFIKTNPDQETRNRIGQLIWDFYYFQIHQLKQFHADPHPGNYLITEEGSLAVLDFGCVKTLPQDFYDLYFKLMEPGSLEDESEMETIFEALDFIRKEDRPEERVLLKTVFQEVISLLARPIWQGKFDFSDSAYFMEIASMAERFAGMKELRKMRSARGPKEGIYLNRTYFGIYNILHALKAEVNTGDIPV